MTAITPSPLVDIVTVGYNNKAEVENLIYELGLFTEHGSYNLIVVDNASEDGTADLAHIKNPMNLGFAHACNQGADWGHAPYICFLNPDIHLPSPHPKEGDWLEQLLFYAQLPNVGAVGPAFMRDMGVYWEWNPNMLVGACILIPREIFYQVGRFDQEYFFTWEDNDLCMKLLEQGYHLMHAPVTIRHEGSRSVYRNETTEKYFQDGMKRFQSKWQDNLLIK